MAHKHRNDGSPAQSEIDIGAAAFGFHKVHDVEHNKTRWTIACQGCGSVETHGWPVNTGADLLTRNMTRFGWRIDKKVQKCPECLKKERQNERHMKAPAGPDPKLARRIYAALDEHFDDAKKLYRSGWDDSKVAGSLDVSLEIVARIRKEAYGELAEPPELQVFRDELALLRMESDDLSARHAAEGQAMIGKIAELEGRISNAPALRKGVC